MSNETEKLAKQLEAARKGMDRYREALSALADAGNTSESEQFKRQLAIARQRMKKYRTVYRALSK